MLSSEECKECHDVNPETAKVHDTESPATTEPLKERPVEEVAARLALQDQNEQETLTCKFAAAHTMKKQTIPSQAVTCFS